MQGLGAADQLIIAAVFLIVGMIVLFIDVIIFGYWFSFKYKEYNFQKTYGPTVTFPPRSEQEAEQQIPANLEVGAVAVQADGAADDPVEEESGTAAEARGLTEAEEDLPPIDPNLMFAQGGIRSPFASTWSLVHPFVAFQLVMIVVGVVSTLPLLPALMRQQLDILTSNYGIGVQIFALTLQNIAFVAVTAYCLKAYGTNLKKIGLKKPSKRELVLGVGFGIGVLLAAMLLEKGLTFSAAHMLPKAVSDRLTSVNDTITAGGMFDKIHSKTAQILFALCGAVMAPIGEEVFFRGLLYNGLKKRWGVAAAVLISAVCFAAIHVGPLAVLVIIPMGALLAIAYEKTGSLWVTIIMHAINNGTQFAMAMYLAKPGS